MKHRIIILIALLYAFAGSVNAVTSTKTYTFHGEQGNSPAEWHGWFTQENSSDKYPDPYLAWTEGTNTSVNFTLAGGITFTLENADKRIRCHSDNNRQGVGGQGDVTITINGGSYFIYHVKMYGTDGNIIRLDAQGEQAVSNYPGETTDFDYENYTNEFTKTVKNFNVWQMEITYSSEDDYLISDETTTISGIEDSYLYESMAVAPEPIVVCNGKTLVHNTDYYQIYSNNNGAGTATVNVTGKDPYHGTVTKSYEIRAVSLDDFHSLGNDTYRIASASELGRLSSYVNAGHDCSGLTFLQTANIECSGTMIKGIGVVRSSLKDTDDGKPFSGTYDGQNYIISDLNVKNLGWTVVNVGGSQINPQVKAESYSGLFTYMNSACVRNVRLVSPLINNITDLAFQATVTKSSGGIAGYAYNSEIDNCLVYKPTFSSKSNSPIVGHSLETTTTDNAEVFKATAGDNMSFAINTIDPTDGFIYDGEYYYKQNASVLFLYNGSAATAANSLTFTDGKGNALTLSSSGISYILAMPNKDITVNANLVPNELTLANDGNNTSAIDAAATVCAGGKTYAVTLADRTLYKDGKWNTLCLPFNLTLEGSQLAGATARTLESASLNDGTLSLNFSEPVSQLTAGTPYIIKWASSSPDIVDPVFEGVTIDNTSRNVTFGNNSFKGTYTSTSFDAENRSILFMGSGNTLYYPGNGATIGACRAYFDLSGSSGVKQFVLNFGEDDDPTVIKDLKDLKDSKDPKDSWFDLSGRKMSNGKWSLPRGIYIHNGKKVIVK